MPDPHSVEQRWKHLVLDTHQALVEAETYVSYSAAVARRYRAFDIFTKWIVAISASAPFIGKLSEISVETTAWFLATVPLLALLLPILRLGDVVGNASSVHGKYVSLLPALQKLWRETCRASGEAIDNPQILDELDEALSRLHERIAEFRTDKLNLPDIAKLAELAKSKIPPYPLPWDLEGYRPPSAFYRAI